MFSSAFVCLFVSEIIQKLLSCTLQFNGHFPDESGLAGCPLNSPPSIPKVCILLGQA